jgi:hypothetical protein
MGATFLRYEAAHFRELADTTEGAQSKLRLLTLAMDYEALANAAEHNLQELSPLSRYRVSSEER